MSHVELYLHSRPLVKCRLVELVIGCGGLDDGLSGILGLGLDWVGFGVGFGGGFGGGLVGLHFLKCSLGAGGGTLWGS